jgi:hypothetical protein
MKWYGLYYFDNLIKVMSFHGKPYLYDFHVPVRQQDTRYTIKEVEISIKVIS